ncbi:MAG TPA: peptidylprolyl isomerase [Gemmataceae bacterium]|nr:peptidylprolyl isomerase [Gemmataceae bacterium]
MRRKSWLILGLAGLTLLATSAAAQQALRPAAMVDGNAITMADVEAVIKQGGPTAKMMTEAQRRDLQHDVLEALINDVLFRQLMRRVGPRIEVVEVDRRIAEVAEAMKKEGKTLQDLFQETGQNEGQLRSEIVTILQWTAFVKDHFSDADVKKYYELNRDFFDGVSVRASHILLRVPHGAPQAEQQALRGRLEAIRQEILAGKIDFAEAAKRYSQDSSAANGGDIGYFPRKLVVDENYAQTAYALKVGEVSPVVPTEFGLYLIKVTDRKPGQPADFNQIKDKVKQLYVEEARMGMIAQYRKSAKIEIYLP